MNYVTIDVIVTANESIIKMFLYYSIIKRGMQSQLHSILL